MIISWSSFDYQLKNCWLCSYHSCVFINWSIVNHILINCWSSGDQLMIFKKRLVLCTCVTKKKKKQTNKQINKSSFDRTQVSWFDLCVWLSETEGRCWNFTDVTLTDEDTNSILTDKVNRTIKGNVAMQLYVTNASSAIWWPNFELMQVMPPGDQIWN